MDTGKDSTTKKELFVNSLPANSKIKSAFEKIYTSKKGDWTSIKKALEKNKIFPRKLISKLSLTVELADWSGNNKELVTLIQNDDDIHSLRDIALKLNRKNIDKQLTRQAIPKGKTKTVYTEDLYKKLYLAEPTAVIVNMINDKAVPLHNDNIGKYISNILSSHPDFNIRTHSIYDLINKKNIFKGLPEKNKAEVMAGLKTLQRISAVSPAPEVIPALISKKYSSINDIILLPLEQFKATMKDSKLPEKTLSDIYTEAVNRKFLYEQIFISIREAGGGSGVSMIDGGAVSEGDDTAGTPGNDQTGDLLSENHLSWDALFGDASGCTCGECTSFYSPAAYLVDLLQYLRNNNLDKFQQGSLAIRPSPTDIVGTPLEVLFSRRPDLGNLDLSCANTKTILPYLDLVNEVMEQYVAFKTTNAFNVGEETSAELLSAPLHTENTKAYQALSEAVYPFTLPYHQPLDTARIFLDYLGTSRFELLRNYISARDNTYGFEPSKQGGKITTNPITYNATNNENSVLDELYGECMERAADAEYLGLTSLEYFAITKEVFVSKNYWDTQYFVGGSHGIHTVDEYQDKIGKIPIEQFYGYSGITARADMFSTDETKKKGLKFVKAQLLPRTGISYEELVELLKTIYISMKSATNGISIVGDKVVLEHAETCDLDAVRLNMGVQLLVEKRYERLHRFIRLWRRLDISIPETDLAIMSLGNGEITPQLLHQLIAVKKLSSDTGLDFNSLLCLWGNISTVGENNLYKKLFLSHNVLAMDTVFKPVNGNYLSNAGMVSEHLPAVMAALNISASDLDAIKTHLGATDIGLSLQNLSLLYRYRLLSKVLGIRIPEFISLVEAAGYVFQSPQATLQFADNLGKLDEASFTHTEVNFIVNGQDNPRKPVSPAEKDVIEITGKIQAALIDIESGHNIPATDLSGSAEDKATTELARFEAALLFDSSSVDSIVRLLDIGNTFIAAAPKGLAFNAPTATTYALLYDTENGTLEITGELNAAAVSFLKLLKDDSNNPLPLGPEWNKAVDEVARQQALVTQQLPDLAKTFQQALGAFAAALPQTVSDNLVSALAGDGILKHSAAQKRLLFLASYLPYLKNQLKSAKIIEIISEYSLLEKDMVRKLLVDILQYGSKSVYDHLASLPDLSVPSVPPPGVPTPVWDGYIFSPVEDEYTIAVHISSDTLFKITIGNAVIIDHQPILPATDIEIEGNAVRLVPGNAYTLHIEGIEITKLSWKTKTMARIPVPRKSMLPEFRINRVRYTLTALKKMGILIQALPLGIEEIDYLAGHKNDFDQLDFNQIDFTALLRLTDYSRLRNALQNGRINILQFWKKLTDPAPDLIQSLHDLTLWDKRRISSLLSTLHFNLGATDFTNEKSLIRLQASVDLAQKLDMDTDLLFQWAQSFFSFDDAKTISDSLQKTIRARYKQSDWEQVVKPLNDLIRNNQRNALTAYLLQQRELKDAGVTDIEGLFEYFLIDVQMDTCMETSRIKQAISSVQLFIQRCFVGLEKDHFIPPNLLNRDRWSWMERYRVWEANRKVLLYPENWIESNLRDDKTPFFKELESELLQKDINKESVIDGIKNYLFKLDEVSNLEVVGLHIEGEKVDDFTWGEGSVLHVFARSRNAPYFFFYRYLRLDEMNWYPWEKMQVDIPCYDVEDPATHKITMNGCYLVPFAWNGRLFIFFPQLMKKTASNDNNNGRPISSIADDSQESAKPLEYWEIKMAWSEYRNGKWTQKQLSADALYHIPVTTIDAIPYSRVTDAIKATKDAAEKAADSGVKTRDAANAEALIAENLRKDAAKATNTVPDSLTAAAIGGPIGLGIASGVIISVVNSLHAKSVTSRNAADVTRDDAVISKGDSADTLVKAKNAAAIAALYNSTGGSVPASGLIDISKYEFLPRPTADNQYLGISIVYKKNIDLGAFEFDGRVLQRPGHSYVNDNSIRLGKSFHYLLTTDHYGTISSLQPYGSSGFIFSRTAEGSKFNSFIFYHSFSKELMRLSNTGDLKAFFDFNLGIGYTPEDAQVNLKEQDEAFGIGYLNTGNRFYNELRRPYALYNWELFFHTPVMIADALSKANQFEESMKWFHYVFNPIADGNDEKRFWRFRPFKETNSQRILEQIFANLRANRPDDAISEWRKHPFKPHLVARSRPVAYMKWMVMKYIDNILAWGDYLYRQDTIESINQATQLYVLAGHILGQRPMGMPKQEKKAARTYLSLLSKWDAASNAISEMEIAGINTAATVTSVHTAYTSLPVPDIAGSLGALYFCIPDNPQLTGLWDTIADRLFKIRHCQNIEGVFRKLPLFEPPIDPALLVKAAAQGLSLSSVINDLYSAMPNYRFYYLLQKALELCSELKSLGAALLSSLEKKDAESLSLVRARHESAMNTLVLEVKKLQLEEAKKTLETLQQNRKTPEARMKYYMQLVGEDVNKIPGTESEFTELANSIEKPENDNGLRLSKFEKEDIDKALEASELQMGIGAMETLAGLLSLIPQFKADVEPIGIGAGADFGGVQISGALNFMSKYMQIFSSNLTFQSSHAAKKSGFQRAMQDRIMQANTAGYELKQIDKQMLSQQIRIQITKQELDNHQKQMDNNREVEDFLKNKFTNEELYNWMGSSLKALHRQVYNLAYDLARKAERAFCFERGISSSNYIQSGYFDAGWQGLLAGENLFVGLKQLESAYQEKRGYDYEITKHVSLRQLDPGSLLQLRVNGYCNFDIPEFIFDMDYPGQYRRRIKSVSISIPCIAGPYTAVNARVQLLGNRFRNSSVAANYPEVTDADDLRFSTYIVPVSAIATSTALNDSGVFELNFKDERYLPFEGSGAISKWRLELPSQRQFDYRTISDLVIHIKYTSVEGGGQLKTAAEKYVKSVLSGLTEQKISAVIDLKHESPNEWRQLKANGNVDLQIDKSRLPYFAQTSQRLGLLNVSKYTFKNKGFKLTDITNDVQPLLFGSTFNVSESDMANTEELFMIITYKS